MICPSCGNKFLQPFVCTTCGAQKLHDHTLEALEKENAELREKFATIRAATIEECAKVCRSVGEDWKKDGDCGKQHAAEYLAELLTTGEKK